MAEKYDFDKLTKEEKEFCELYVNDPTICGDELRCYKRAISSSGTLAKAKKLLLRKDIQEYVMFLDCPEENETVESRILRKKLTNKLLKIADECADDCYTDRRGNQINPSGLRSVAVNAIRMVSELNGLKKQSDTQPSGSSEKGGGITFNVIVPSSTPEVQIEQEES